MVRTEGPLTSSALLLSDKWKQTHTKQRLCSHSIYPHSQCGLELVRTTLTLPNNHLTPFLPLSCFCAPAPRRLLLWCVGVIIPRYYRIKQSRLMSILWPFTGTPSYTPFWVFIVFPCCWYLMVASCSLPALACSLFLRPLCRSLTSKLYRNVFVALPVPVGTFTCFLFPFWLTVLEPLTVVALTAP